MSDHSKIKAEKLCQLTGLTDRRHRQIAKEGYFSPPENGEYLLAPTLLGLFRYYRELSQKRTAGMQEEKERRERAKRRKEEVEAEKAEEAVIAMDDAKQVFFFAYTALKTRALSLPSAMAPLLVGKDAVEIDEQLKKEILEIFNEVSTHEWSETEEVLGGGSDMPAAPVG